MTTLPPFEIHRASSVAEASALIEELGEDAVLYSGGTELLLLMKLGFAAYGHLVDVKLIRELSVVEVADGRLVIGGAVTHRVIERSSLVRKGWPDLAAMERHVANVRVRATGSLGGNLAFADPHSDPATFLIAAGARVRLGKDDRVRSMPIDELVLGPYETALEPGEVLMAVEVPALPDGTAMATGMAHVRFAFHERPAATLSAWVRVADGAIAEARLAIGSVGILPVLVREVVSDLVGQPASDPSAGTLAAIGEAAAEASEPVTDSNGSQEYKRALVRVLAGRALRQAAGRALERAAA